MRVRREARCQDWRDCASATGDVAGLLKAWTEHPPWVADPSGRSVGGLRGWPDGRRRVTRAERSVADAPP